MLPPSALSRPVQLPWTTGTVKLNASPARVTLAQGMGVAPWSRLMTVALSLPLASARTSSQMRSEACPTTSLPSQLPVTLCPESWAVL